jgi:hypothetical protein
VVDELPPVVEPLLEELLLLDPVLGAICTCVLPRSDGSSTIWLRLAS